MKVHYSFSEVFQIMIIIFTIIILTPIIKSPNYKELFFLNYINSVSLVASIILLLIAILTKIRQEKFIVVTDQKNYIKYTLWLITLIIILSTVYFSYMSIGYITLTEKKNDVIGIVSLCIALSTDILANVFVYFILRKAKKKYKVRYNDLYN
ncbi:hypothetical protein METH109765_09385 [Mesobacillus thioparans]